MATALTNNPTMLGKFDNLSVSNGGTGTGTGGSAAGGAVADASSSKVAMGDPDGSLGDYSTEEISRVMKAHAGVLRACYQKTLQTTPKLAGKFTYEITIDGTGAVSRVKLKSSTTKSTPLDDCLKNQIMRFKFGAKGTGAVVVYPFVFAQQ
jgi:hypothetical protein